MLGHISKFEFNLTVWERVVGGWGSCCTDWWLLLFGFSVVPIRMAYVALGGGCPSACGGPLSLSCMCVLSNFSTVTDIIV